MRAEPVGERRGLVDVDAGRVEPAGLEDQRLFHVERAIAGEGLRRGGGVASPGWVGRPWLFMGVSDSLACRGALTATGAARSHRRRGPRRC